jgi:hypothetical protein
MNPTHLLQDVKYVSELCVNLFSINKAIRMVSKLEMIVLSFT